MSLSLWGGCGVALIVAIGSSLAERRRVKRSNLDRPGFIPWTFIMTMAAMVAMACLALAVRAG